MGRNSPEPLTTEQAKSRLRVAAQNASPTTWFQRHPWEAIVIALASGFVFSRTRVPEGAGVLMTRLVAPLLLGNTIRQVQEERSERRR